MSRSNVLVKFTFLIALISQLSLGMDQNPPQTYGASAVLYEQKDGKTVFLRTKKEKYTPSWRIIETGSYDTDDTFESAFLRALSKDDTNEMTRLMSLLPFDGAREPWIRSEMVRAPHIFYYVIEKVISRSREAMSTLLDRGFSANGLPDYNPTKSILKKLSAPGDLVPDEARKLKQNLQILIDRGANLDTPFPAHDGWQEDGDVNRNCTAKEYLAKTKNTWNDADWQDVSAMFASATARSVVPPVLFPAPNGRHQQKVTTWTKYWVIPVVLLMGAGCYVAYKKYYATDDTEDGDEEDGQESINNENGQDALKGTMR